MVGKMELFLFHKVGYASPFQFPWWGYASHFVVLQCWRIQNVLHNGGESVRKNLLEVHVEKHGFNASPLCSNTFSPFNIATKNML